MRLGIKAAAVILTAAAFSACGGAKLVVTGNAPQDPVRFIVSLPGNADFSDDLAAALSARGYSTLDRKTSSQLFYRLGLPKDAEPDMKGMSKLKRRKVDLVMNVQAKICETFGVRGRPETVQVSVRATSDGGPVANLGWVNAWGGMRGSGADMMMMQRIPAAANSIANALVQYLGRPAPREPLNMDDLPSTPVAIMLQDDKTPPPAARPAAAASAPAAPAPEPAPQAPVKHERSAEEKSRFEYDMQMLVP